MHGLATLRPLEGFVEVRLCALRRHLIVTDYTHDVQSAEHDRVLSIRQRYHHPMLYDGGVLRMLDPKDVTAAASNLERAKGCLEEQELDLLEHVRILRLAVPETSAGRAKLLASKLIL
jgi:hypothetical protein